MLRALVLTAIILSAPAAPEVEITAEPHHHFTFANKYVRVFNLELAAHSDTLMHWHRHDYMYVVLGASHVANEVKDKPAVEVSMGDGATGFLPATFVHRARNLSDQPFRNVTIELLTDEALRAHPRQWDEDRGLDILPGGTKQILFVHDGVRASDIQLQPNGVASSVPRSGPVLLVAVNDLDLYTNDPRTHDMHETSVKPTHLSVGQSVWLPSGFRHPLINAGQRQARFVTFEFP